VKSLSWQAKSYILGIILVGVGLLIWQSAHLEGQLIWLLMLSALGSMAMILKIEGSTHESSYNISWIVYGFTFVLLGTPAALLVIVVSHLADWIWHRYPWYIQSFNIANFAIAISAADLVYSWMQPTGVSNQIWEAFGLLTALIVFTLTNHFLIGVVLKLARGQSFRQSGVFGLITLMIDFAMLGTGAVAALIWRLNPYAVPLSVLPIYLIYNTLKVPALQRQTEIDPKTKLYNVEYFANVMEKELARAIRYDRPLTIVIGDLDLLRNINNTYGHLAGDVVLIGVAEILQEHVGDNGVVARFGGEEFAILLPEILIDDAYLLIERIRSAIEAADFEITTSITPIKATLSFGIACREENDQTINDLIHKADLALYHSKTSGRNITSVISNESYQELSDILNRPVGDELKSRVETSQNRFRPNPLRNDLAQQAAKRAEPEEAEMPMPISNKPKPAWVINLYIGAIALAAVGVFGLVFTSWHYPVNWLVLVAFCLMIVITETLAIEIYVKDTSISTSGVILLAGVLILGPYGALVLSLALAATAKIIHRSEIKRFIFNASNHLLYSSVITGLILITGGPISALPVLNNLVLCIFAALLAFLGNTIFVAGAIGLSSGQSIRAVWVDEFRWLLPYYLAYGVVAFGMVLGLEFAGLLGVVVVLVPLLVLRFSQYQYINHTKGVVKQLHQKNTLLEKQALEISKFDEELLLTLAELVDLKDPYLSGHSKHVAGLGARIAEEMGLPQERVKVIQKAGWLHDIGKLAIPDQILQKTDKLTPEEYDIVKRHADLGAKIVGNVQTLKDLVPILRFHHEHFDGNGYPDGLKGEMIPIEARIVALVDAFDSMSYDRPYRKAYNFEHILNEINQKSGTQFDPVVVEVFSKIVQKEGEAALRIFASRGADRITRPIGLRPVLDLGYRVMND
jgi:diguanylate cyclase (GGDEF)-like protein/putative nucleotidyltransferase with HDIG domain